MMRKLLSILLTILLIVSAVPLGAFSFVASAATEGYYTYTVSNGKATITKFDTTVSGAINIPSNLGGYPVVCIDKNAFWYASKITAVTIPNTVTTINSYAFDTCGITSVDIPDSVTSIGSYAFDSCSNLLTVRIPINITSISNGMFYQCRNLQTIKIPKGVTSVGDYAFYGCNNLTDVWYAGNEQQRGNISISKYGNEYLDDATWHYNSCPIAGIHTYNNVCDADCNLCGEIRDINHVYAYNGWIITTEATCVENGSRYRVCTICDYIFTETIAATGVHNYESVVIEPTCTQQGYTAHTCSDCGNSYVDSYVNAKGHSYDDDFDAFCNECVAEREPKKHGDTNGDHIINNRDLGLLMQYINGWDVEIETASADVNDDDHINNKDYALIIRYINGWDVELQ